MAARLALGTVQFGTAYGISNPAGQVAEADVATILAAARVAGIDLIDTAPAYGTAEAVLGRQDLGGFGIVSKVPPIAGADAGGVARSARASLQTLGIGRLDGLLLHRATDALGPSGAGIRAALEQAREEGLARRVGVSAYGAEDLVPLLELWRPDLVQIPVSVLDQRLIGNGLLRRLADAGVAIHVRSAFLQGVVAMNPASLPAGLAALAPPLSALRERAAAARLTPIAAALAFVRDLPEVEAVVIGVTAPAELRAGIDAFATAPAFDGAGLGVSDEALVDPRRWPK